MTEAQTQPVAARFVGSSVARKEDRRLVTGHGRYVDDVVLPGQLHLAFRRSDVAAGRLVSVDVSAAALPGVVRVFTAEDINPHHGEAWHGMLSEAMTSPPPLAQGRVKHVGDPIACVVATSRAIAEDACDLIEVEIEPEPAVVDYRIATEADDAHVVHADWGLESNAMVDVPFTAVSPDVEEAFARAAHVVEADIEQNRYLAVPMETRGILASWDEGLQELYVCVANQSTHGTRDFYARYLGIPEANVTVEMRDVGGGFGQKMFVFREENAVVLASKLLQRPVKWIEDRLENLIAGPHARNEWARARLAVEDDLTMSAIACEHKADVGAYPIVPGGMMTALLPGPYRIPRVGFATSMRWTNTMGRGAYRGPWMFETTVREMLIDIAARDLGIDPVELRRRNLLSAADLPFTSPTGQLFEEITPLETLEQAVAMLDYEAFRAEQAAARAEGRYLGVGFSTYVEPTTMAVPTLHSEGCTVRIEADGHVTAYLGTTSHGQSIETTMAQVVADGLGVNYEDVTVVQGTSRGTPWGGGTGGSRTATLAGGAAHSAALAVREKVLTIAAHQMEAAPDDLEIERGVISVRGTPARSTTVREVAMSIYRDPSGLIAAGIEPSVEATVRFQPNRYPTWSNATHVCVVEVDAGTWVPKILRYIVSEDCGRMINPQVVEGQIFGGVVQGLGGVLLENFVYDDVGNPLTTTFMDYLLPTAAEVPGIEVGHIETDSTTNPGGFKGMGEGGAIGSHAAVANAVGDALHHLGVRVTRTPLGPNDIFELVKAAGALD